MRAFDRFLCDERGATAVEYALFVAGISVAMIIALHPLGGQLKTTFTAAKDGLEGAGK
jgi:Flp pilus assembly pilin Flp